MKINLNMCKGLLILLSILLTARTGFTQQTVSKTVIVYFESDKSELTPASKKTLQEFLKTIDTLSGVKMTVTGHTDSEGSSDYNDQLSERRVKAVLGYMDKTKKKPLPQVVSQLPKGEEKPVASNDSEAGMARNRRVEIRYSYALPMPEKAVAVIPAAAVVPTEPVKKTPDIQDLYNRLKPEGTVYCIDTKRDTFLVCEKGTVIHIPANSFKSQKQCTRITVTEALSYSDILLQNLSTDSPEGLLITGGMINITAEDQSGKPLRLQREKRLTVFFPTDSVNDQMKTYYGNRDTTHQQTMHWSQDTKWPNPNGGGGVPANFWTNCWTAPPSCTRCKFFCRIGRAGQGIRGIFNTSQRNANQSFRICQRRLRTLERQPLSSQCQQQLNYMISIGMTPDTVLFKALYDNYMKENGLETIEEAIEKMKKDQEKADELAAKSFNIVQSASMGYINCDYFPGKGNQDLTVVRTDLYATSDVDCKMLFQDIHSVMPGYVDADHKFQFPNIPRGKNVWIFALKLDEEGQAYLHLGEYVVGQDKPEITFKAVSEAELKDALKVLNK